jgi:hypothetical protein
MEVRMSKLVCEVILMCGALGAQSYLILGSEIVATGNQTAGSSYILMAEGGTGWPGGTASGASYVLNHGLFGFEPSLHVCGDVNGDGNVTTGDGYTILNYFGAGPQPVSCWAANVNGDGNLTPGDGYYLLNYFGGGPALNCAPCSFTGPAGRGDRAIQGGFDRSSKSRLK